VAESPADGYFFPFSSCGFENPQAQKNNKKNNYWQGKNRSAAPALPKLFF
jgi:hypothetical protein